MKIQQFTILSNTLLLLGLVGDIFTATGTRSFTGGSTIFDFNYLVPFNALDGTIQLRTTIDHWDNIRNVGAQSLRPPAFMFSNQKARFLIIPMQPELISSAVSLKNLPSLSV
ncbi:MAG: hypothetical protein F6K47_01395 [Symploca sp. SIO2E6]|nr:hypothetical protein [Symploca sp. SIO2E6]